MKTDKKKFKETFLRKKESKRLLYRICNVFRAKIHMRKIIILIRISKKQYERKKFKTLRSVGTSGLLHSTLRFFEYHFVCFHIINPNRYKEFERIFNAAERI